MSLILGKSFDRNYTVRIPFLDGHYNVGTFFNKKSTFLLFGVEPDHIIDHKSVKINMYKNLRTSKFCETFINLHDYKKTNLDIINQYDSIREVYKSDISLFLNETIQLSKVDVDQKSFYDVLTIYGFTLTSYVNEFVFLIAERQNIIRKLSKKMVRTTGIQISTNNPINLLNEFHEDFKKEFNVKHEEKKETIKFSEL